MFKKILIAGLLVLGGLWAAGYDFGGVKDDILRAADGNADELTGRGGPGDWGI